MAGAFLADVDRLPLKSKSEFCVVRATHTGSKAWASSVVPHFSLSHRVSLSLRGMIFTRARVSLALLSIPKEKRGLLVIWEKSRKNHAKNRAIQRHTGNIVPLTKKRLRAPFVARKNMIRSRVLQVPGYYEEKKLTWRQAEGYLSGGSHLAFQAPNNKPCLKVLS